MRRVLVSFFVLVLACESAPRVPPAEQPQKLAPASQRMFDLRSNPWVNLHHVLYQQGLAEHGADIDGRFEPRELAAWQASVAYYRDNVSKRSTVTDDELIAVNQALSDRPPEAPDLAGTSVPRPHAEALERAMPIYRKHMWQRDDAASRAWATTVAAKIDTFAAPVAADLARLFHHEWPSDPLRVDVTTWAPPPGAAYTTFGPPHLTIDGTDPRNQGNYAFEIVMHECSHLVIRDVRDALAKELEAQGKKERDLWHAVLFYTSGWAVAQRIPGHQPYADHERVYDYDRWPLYRKAIEAHWLPYLEGKQSYEAALKAVVSAL